MRSFNQLPQNNFFPSYPQSNSLTSPPSDFLSMLAANLESSQASARTHQPVDFSESINKKLKSSLSTYHVKAPSNSLTLNDLLYQQNPLYNMAAMKNQIPMKNHLMNEQFLEEYGRIQQLQNFNFMLNMNGQMPQNQPFMLKPLATNNFKLGQHMAAKEEFVKQEEVSCNSKWDNLGADNHSTSETDHRSERNATTDVCSEVDQQGTIQETEDIIGEPALFEFTREFPDYDLITMFRYLRGRKSRAQFEHDLKFKIEKKMRKQKNLAKKKEKALTVQAKQPKGKKKAAPRDEGKAQK